MKTDRTGAAYVLIPSPPHAASHAPFLIMHTPVTNAMWRAAVAAGACSAPHTVRAYDDPAKAHHPVVHITRAQARQYAAWVGGRLPRDAEWTWAAQGDDGRMYPWGDQPPDATRANYGMHIGDTTPVGSYPAGASPYGVLDMAGNVWEWVDDGQCAVRGGAFSTDADDVVCDSVCEGDEDYDDFNVGLRVVSSGM